MINKENMLDVLEQNQELLSLIQSRVEATKDQSVLFRYKPVESIKAYLMKQAKVIQFPSMNTKYGGLVTYRNGRFYIHINTAQPKTYENLVWAHEYYHFVYESESIKNTDNQTFIEDGVYNTFERAANLFAAELLMDQTLLKAQFNSISEIYAGESLESRVVRLIPTFKIPYKAIVLKLTQENLIKKEEAIEIIDYDYKENLPLDFDQSILQPSMAIQINNLKQLLSNDTVQQKMKESDLISFQKRFAEHYEQLEALRGSKERVQF